MLGAGALAFWMFARVPRLAPHSVGGGFVHVFASVVLAHLATGLIDTTIAIPTIGLYLVVLVLVVAPLTYMLLSCMWLVNAALRSAVSSGLR